MNKEAISGKQAVCIMILFFSGTSAIMTRGLEAEQDLWLAIILSVSITLPMVLIYAHLHYIFKDKDLFDILEICFGKFIGKGISILYVWFFLDIMAVVIRNISQFITITSMTDTSLIIPMILIGILCIWSVKEGIEVIGRWGECFIIIYIACILIIIILAIFENGIISLNPMLYKGMKPVMEGAFFTFTFPFGEVIVFTAAFSGFKMGTSSYKVYIRGLFIGGLIVLVTSITTILILGVALAQNLHYPAYSAIARLSIGDVLQRLEVIIAIIFILGGFIKSSIYLLATCRGFTKIFEYKDYRFIVTPVTLLIINLSYFEFDSIMDYVDWNVEVYPYYAVPFLVILPIIILITAEIKKKRLFINQNI
ncbi:GerAB/ArcD/ProY family transporter [Tepidibacter hydrothermalis]|uniref:Endospore germination permease n=1 Tax=Tepidibacter hydrothermalis TaxID=3036126 RepID=A0ABY8ECY1_9FIRM|nr:endospore germination permease [Tepidibacter hydrothermalis]WFD10792.1 endospore germination permease [Tepidibacter hydrothermalis]